MVLEHLLEKRLRLERNANGQNMNYPGTVDGPSDAQAVQLLGFTPVVKNRAVPGCSIKFGALIEKEVLK